MARKRTLDNHGVLTGVKDVAFRLLPEEHGIVAQVARRLGITQSEAAALGIQLLREAPRDEIEKRMREEKGGRVRPVREYDPETGRVILPG